MRGKLPAVLCGVLAALAVAAPAQEHSPSDRLAAQTQRRLEALSQGFDGVVGIYAKGLRSGYTFAVQPDNVFPQASSIKIPILLALLDQAQQGRLRLEDRVAIRQQARTGGSGVLQYFSDGGSELSLHDLAVLMIVLSDNTATNLLLDRLGLEAVNAFLHRQGLVHTRLQRRMMDTEAERADKENLATPREMAVLLERLYRGEILDGRHTELALRILEADKATPLRAAIPAGIAVADKPGALNGVRCDSGLVLAGEPYVVAIMTAYNHDDAAAEQLITNVSLLLYLFYSRLAASNRYGVRLHP
jgi:beta-lactamase class A